MLHLVNFKMPLTCFLSPEAAGVGMTGRTAACRAPACGLQGEVRAGTCAVGELLTLTCWDFFVSLLS